MVTAIFVVTLLTLENALLKKKKKKKETALLRSSEILYGLCCLLADPMLLLLLGRFTKGMHKLPHLQILLLGHSYANVIYWELITKNPEKNSWCRPSRSNVCNYHSQPYKSQLFAGIDP